MSSSYSLVWGLMGDQLCEGQLLDSTTAIAVQQAGWNPPIVQISGNTVLRQQLQGVQHLGSSAADSNIQQLAVGWHHALLLLLDGQVFVCDACDWRGSCEHAQAADKDARKPLLERSTPWQLLQLPALSQQQQQQQQQQQRLPLYHSPARALTAAPDHKVMQVAAGDAHCLLLTQAGSVWAFGSNQYGQLGCMQAQHTSAQQPVSCSPARRTGSAPSTAAASTGQHSTSMQVPAVQEPPGGIGPGEGPLQRRQRLMQLRERQQQHQQQQQQQQPAAAVGRGYCQGAAGAGQQQLGQQPVLVLGPGADSSACQEAVAQVAAGACHSAAVTATSGQLYCWGWNLHGQCCTGSTANVSQPQLCAALDGVPLAAVAAGMAHTVCVSSDGAVYACGWNSSGQLGTARQGQHPAAGHAGQSAAGQAAAAAAGEDGSGRLRKEGRRLQQQQELICVSSLRPVLVEAPELDQEDVVQVACGSRHTVVLTASGSVFAWGCNKYGQCCSTGRSDDLLQPTQVVLPQQQDQLSQPGKRAEAVTVHAGRWHSSIIIGTV